MIYSEWMNRQKSDSSLQGAGGKGEMWPPNGNIKFPWGDEKVFETRENSWLLIIMKT